MSSCAVAPTAVRASCNAVDSLTGHVRSSVRAQPPDAAGSGSGNGDMRAPAAYIESTEVSSRGGGSVWGEPNGGATSRHAAARR
eukprot:4690625-Pleurochrysis_carterae.AAC.1